MSVQSCGGGFIAQCPNKPCEWHVFSSEKAVARALLEAHKCKEARGG